MKRSAINRLIRSAEACFHEHHWFLPPNPRWDVTDFGLGDSTRHGLVLVNLAEEPEYCEKLMYARQNMVTPAHCHRKKKEDIVCRWGELAVQVWSGPPGKTSKDPFILPVNHEPMSVRSGETLTLPAGSRVTLVPGVYHAFYPVSAEAIIGEVSTANDDTHDNIFVNPEVGRYPGIEEDEPVLRRLISES